MRRMLPGICAIVLCGSVAVLAFAADAPVTDGPTGPAVGERAAPVPDSGPFAVAAAQTEAATLQRYRAARDRASAVQDGYATHEPGDYRPSTAPRPDAGPAQGRVRVIGGVAERLGVGRRTMWHAIIDVRRQIAPRAWSDARDEALRMLARELDRPFADVKGAVRAELRREFRAAPGGGR